MGSGSGRDRPFSSVVAPMGSFSKIRRDLSAENGSPTLPITAGTDMILTPAMMTAWPPLRKSGSLMLWRRRGPCFPKNCGKGAVLWGRERAGMIPPLPGFRCGVILPPPISSMRWTVKGTFMAGALRGMPRRRLILAGILQTGSISEHRRNRPGGSWSIWANCFRKPRRNS